MHTATRQIEFDAAHRVPDHESKCKNIHGHRYKVELSLFGHLIQGGSEDGMVTDFGIMKQVLMDDIHDQCDHGLILSASDSMTKAVVDENALLSHKIIEAVREGTSLWGPVKGYPGVEKVFLIHGPPTAENLAYIFWNMVAQDPYISTANGIKVMGVTVYETPNCWANYEAKLER